MDFRRRFCAKARSRSRVYQVAEKPCEETAHAHDALQTKDTPRSGQSALGRQGPFSGHTQVFEAILDDAVLSNAFFFLIFIYRDGSL